jgi:hypothetical protein
MTVYEEILNLVKQLSSDERLQLADSLLEEEFGFGMWRDRPEMNDVAAYVERMREAEMRTPEGRLKTSEEFLADSQDVGFSPSDQS